MATDRLTVPISCPACNRQVRVPTNSAYNDGMHVVAFDLSAVREHVAQHEQASNPEE
ncbi:hypothetical protein ABZ498_06550 [Streptomyces lavendulocolor]|uniref:hypothetical protein n=1 Tax=Streptomyces lavendulocolor TaxID=67316 RepID=UPI0033C18886